MSRTTRIAARTVGAVAVVALGLTLGACSGGSAPAAAPSESVSATASPSPTELSPEEEAIAQAEPAVEAYYKIKDASLQSPEAFKPKRFETAAITTARSELEDLHNSAKAQEVHQVGETRVVSIEDPQVDLTFKPKATPPEIPTVQFTVCYDISGYDTVDKSGTSIIPPGRQERVVTKISVYNYEYPEGPWLVGYVERQDDKTC